jgi:hypothetical protein
MSGHPRYPPKAKEIQISNIVITSKVWLSGKKRITAILLAHTKPIATFFPSIHKIL